MIQAFVDIHCHILPGIDDGPPDWAESISMAEMAVDDGITTIIATPHQLGAFTDNTASRVLPLVEELQERINAADIPLRVLAGGELRIEPELVSALHSGTSLSLGNHLRHVLIELPHDIFLPIETLLSDLFRRDVTPILAHPERNGGILRDPSLVSQLVAGGCLMQITASSLSGAFGRHCQRLSEHLLENKLVHFVASDGHGIRSRRPLLARAFDRVAELVGHETAVRICSTNPAHVAANEPVPLEAPCVVEPRRSWFRRRAAG